MRLRNVSGTPGLARDERGVVHNINTTEVEQARARKARQKQKEEEFDELREEVSEMKNILTQILEKLNG